MVKTIGKMRVSFPFTLIDACKQVEDILRIKAKDDSFDYGSRKERQQCWQYEKASKEM